MSDIRITDNSKTFVNEMANKVERTLEALGIHIEGEAKEELENSPRRVDTGTLKNSITHQYVPSEKAVYIGTNVEYAAYV